MKIAIVLTSHDALGATGRPTGYWVEEFAAPYYAFLDGGVDVVLASPKGGRPPVDPTSLEAEHQTENTRRLAADAEAQARLADTVTLDALTADALDGVFFPGGHGPLYDLVDDPRSIALIEALHGAGKPVAAVCHGPVVLVGAKAPDGRPLVAGRRVTAFSNAEEEAIGLADVVPFLLETKLESLGAAHSKALPFDAHVVRDGHLLTGQNPASSAPLADAVLERLRAAAS